MTKKEALNSFPTRRSSDLNAVSQWDDKKIPELRKYQIKDLIDERDAQRQEAEPA